MSLLSPLRKVLPSVLGYTKQRLERILYPPVLEYAPAGWDTVLETGTAGWNSSRIVAEEKQKWEIFCQLVKAPGPLGFSHEECALKSTSNISFHNLHITYGYVLGLAARQKPMLRVLDYGGGLGHYYLLGRSLFPDIELAFHCKEMPAIATAGNILNPEVVWFSDDSCLNNFYDLVMISSSLQYIEKWQEQLCAIANATDEYLFLMRIPFIDHSSSFVAIQKAYGTKMLHWQFNKRHLINHIENLNFKLVREFVVGDKPYIENAPEQCELGSLLFKKIS